MRRRSGRVKWQLLARAAGSTNRPAHLLKQPIGSGGHPDLRDAGRVLPHPIRGITEQQRGNGRRQQSASRHVTAPAIRSPDPCKFDHPECRHTAGRLIQIAAPPDVSCAWHWHTSCSALRHALRMRHSDPRALESHPALPSSARRRHCSDTSFPQAPGSAAIQLQRTL